MLFILLKKTVLITISLKFKTLIVWNYLYLKQLNLISKKLGSSGKTFGLPTLILCNKSTHLLFLGTYVTYWIWLLQSMIRSFKHVCIRVGDELTTRWLHDLKGHFNFIVPDSIKFFAWISSCCQLSGGGCEWILALNFTCAVVDQSIVYTLYVFVML